MRKKTTTFHPLRTLTRWVFRVDIFHMLVLVGSFLGLVFLLGGISGATSRIRLALHSRRLRRHGVTVEAEVLRSRALSDNRRDAPSAVFIVGQWPWKQAYYKGEFTVPARWWKERAGTSIAVRIDPNRPQFASIEHGSTNHGWKALLVLAWIVMAVVGLAFLFRTVAFACDQVQYDFIEPVCQSLSGVLP